LQSNDFLLKKETVSSNVGFEVLTAVVIKSTIASIFDTEDGGDIFPPKVGSLLTEFTPLYTGR
jgi:hypothetical protein